MSLDGRLIKPVNDILWDLWKPALVVFLLLVVSPIAVTVYRQLHKEQEVPIDDGTNEEGFTVNTAVSLWFPFSIGLGLFVALFMIVEVIVSFNMFTADPQGLERMSRTDSLRWHVDKIKGLKLRAVSNYVDDTASIKVPKIEGVNVSVALVNLYNNPEKLIDRLLVQPGTTLADKIDMSMAVPEGMQLMELERPKNEMEAQFQNYLQAIIQIYKIAVDVMTV